jgi:mRNA interferase RelE/StbE
MSAMPGERRGLRPVAGSRRPTIPRRGTTTRTAVAVAAAVTEFLTGALLDNPHRVGKPLTRELAGYHSARRGAYRVVYRIDEPARTVHVVRINHRADVYRTR